ncbi:hypothetical protein KS44_19920 [Pectobacterium brasiliense]|uniref:Uncharacterized protein n=1 Tax=Pectobacterium brasiliense TaxID=180957 RepID=A0A0M2EZR9_9GAMM|nr:hypothetical protein KS44_19920 [Pectobacterium brasiliense]KGA33045.1 hypothetical protein KU74_14165 [Pectobacterium brasiliense]KMK83198.1 hypothetical protein KCO_16402 [Pectobacterium brasiliense ICMP 19477]
MNKPEEYEKRVTIAAKVADFTLKREKSSRRHDLRQFLPRIFPYAVHHKILKIRYIFNYIPILRVVDWAFSQ